MSKRKKIFHKPDENIPSPDDILSYLNKDESPIPPAPKKKSSAEKSKKESRKKMELEDDLLSSKDEVSEEISRSSPAPTGGFVGSKSFNETQNFYNKNKKDYELEKAMLSEPLISDAVEGYALLNDKEIAKTLIAEINQGIYNQTSRRNNRAVVMRIASIILVICLLSGGSLVLYDQLSNQDMAPMSNRESAVPGTIGDSVSLSNKNGITDTVQQLAIEREKPTDKKANGEYKIQPENTQVNSDANLSREEAKDGPVTTGPKGSVTNTLGPVVMKEEESKKEVIAVVTDKRDMDSVIVPTTVAKPTNIAMNEYTGDDVVQESKSDIYTNRKSTKTTSKKAKANTSPQYRDSDNADLSPATRSETVPSKDKAPTGDNKKGVYLLEDGIRLYNEGKYKEAKTVFTGLLVTQPSNQEAIFYMGMSDYKLKVYESALSNLKKVIPASKRYDEARWQIARIYLETGKKENAKLLLQELSRPGNSYSDKALEELKKIE